MLSASSEADIIHWLVIGTTRGRRFTVMIKIRNLTKQFKDLLAVDNVNLNVEEGECFGLLGPNGAGKTSLIRMLTAVSPPSAGDIWVGGKDLRTHSRQVKAVLGVVPQMDNLDSDLTVRENLVTFARYFNISRDEASRRSREVLRFFELEAKSDSPIKELSGGMKRRLLLARGLLNMPRVLVLDEPTMGLDPQARFLVWHKLTELKSQGVTHLLCTQNMEEAATLCDRVAIMHLGKILTVDTPRELISRCVGAEVGEIELNPEERDITIRKLGSQQMDFEQAGNRIYLFHVQADTYGAELGELSGRMKRRAATLEDVFLRLTGRSLVE